MNRPGAGRLGETDPHVAVGSRQERWVLVLSVVASRGCLEAKRIETDEAGGIVLIVGFFGSAFHGSHLFTVKAVWRAASRGHGLAFVELETDFSTDLCLRVVDHGLEGIAFWCEPEAVVNELCILRNEAIPDGHDLAVQGEGLKVAVSVQEDGATWSFIDTAALHSNKAVFDDIDTADSVAASEEVEHPHHPERVEQGVSVLGPFGGDS